MDLGADVCSKKTIAALDEASDEEIFAAGDVRGLSWSRISLDSIAHGVQVEGCAFRAGVPDPSLAATVLSNCQV